MKSTWRGNLPNMRGKKVYRFRCGCCEAIDYRDEIETRAAIRQMRDMIANPWLYDLHPAEVRLYRECGAG